MTSCNIFFFTSKSHNLYRKKRCVFNEIQSNYASRPIHFGLFRDRYNDFIASFLHPIDRPMFTSVVKRYVIITWVLPVLLHLPSSSLFRVRCLTSVVVWLFWLRFTVSKLSRLAVSVSLSRYFVFQSRRWISLSECLVFLSRCFISLSHYFVSMSRCFVSLSHFLLVILTSRSRLVRALSPRKV